jgi:transcriptional regulator
MYLPKSFEENRIEVLYELIRTHPLGALVTLTPDGLDANHIPFEIDLQPPPFGTLRGHIARANPLWQHLSNQTPVLAIFQGPNTYISPSSYPTKKETGRVVPTWNYAVVHVHGSLQVIEDRTWLRRFVENLTNRHERSRGTPWKVTDAPSDYIEEQLSAIVGLEMRISRLVGKWKVSQNRSIQDQKGVMDGLLAEGSEDALAISRLIQGTNP